MQLALFPAPREATISKARINITDAEWIVLPHPCSQRLLERVQESAARLSIALNRRIRVAAAAPQQGAVLLEIRTGGKRLADQGFELKLSNAGQLLQAGDEAGAFYGCLAFGSAGPGQFTSAAWCSVFEKTEKTFGPFCSSASGIGTVS